jgi:choline dehydrogenase-like flavoprotein
VLLAASTLESARLMLLSKSSLYPNGIGNSSGHVGHNFCEHLMGPGVYGLDQGTGGQAAHTRRRPPRLLLPGALPQPDGSQPEVPPRLRIRRRQRNHMFPDNAYGTPGFGSAYKKTVRDYAGAFIGMGGFGEVLPRYDNYVELDPQGQGPLGHSGAALPHQVRRQRKEDGGRHGRFGARDVRSGRYRGAERDREILTEGWSIHELGTSRMGADPKKSVVNQFQQSHDVQESAGGGRQHHVSASCQNPTWTIMALCWRSCDHLAEEMRKGNV